MREEGKKEKPDGVGCEISTGLIQVRDGAASESTYLRGGIEHLIVLIHAVERNINLTPARLPAKRFRAEQTHGERTGGIDRRR